MKKQKKHASYRTYDMAHLQYGSGDESLHYPCGLRITLKWFLFTVDANMHANTSLHRNSPHIIWFLSIMDSKMTVNLPWKTRAYHMPMIHFLKFGRWVFKKLPLENCKSYTQYWYGYFLPLVRCLLVRLFSEKNAYLTIGKVTVIDKLTNGWFNVLNNSFISSIPPPNHHFIYLVVVSFISNRTQ